MLQRHEGNLLKQTTVGIDRHMAVFRCGFRFGEETTYGYHERKYVLNFTGFLYLNKNCIDFFLLIKAKIILAVSLGNYFQ